LAEREVRGQREASALFDELQQLQVAVAAHVLSSSDSSLKSGIVVVEVVKVVVTAVVVAAVVVEPGTPCRCKDRRTRTSTNKW
jgi:hypothetical protein